MLPNLNLLISRILKEQMPKNARIILCVSKKNVKKYFTYHTLLNYISNKFHQNLKMQTLLFWVVVVVSQPLPRNDDQAEEQGTQNRTRPGGTQNRTNVVVVVVAVTRPLPRIGGMAEDHGAPETGQLSRAWTRGGKEIESRQRASGAKSP